jgi:hypothetical protein
MGWVANATPRPLYPLERDPVPIVQEAGWPPGQFCTLKEYLAPTGIRFPDRPPLVSRSEVKGKGERFFRAVNGFIMLEISLAM